MVTFTSHATNLVAGDVNGASDVFVRDRATGVTELVSRSSAGLQASWNCEAAAFAAQGRFVAFQSFASNLAPDPNGLVRDIFVHDLWSGVTTLDSVGPQGQVANQNCDAPTLSGDGRLLAFHSASTNLVAGDTNGSTDVFVRDRVAGTTVRVSLDSAGLQATSYSFHPAFSRNGRFVAFQSGAALVPGDEDGGFSDVYVRDLAAGQTLAITALDPLFASNTAITAPSISGDGRRVAFQAAVVVYPVVETSQVFVHDRVSGATSVSSVRHGEVGDGDSTAPALSANGRWIGFESRATNLIDGDTNAAADVLMRRLSGP